MSDYIEIELGSSFLLNAGILGFLKLLEYDKAEDFYEINGQVLRVEKQYFLERDLAQLFVETMVNNFRKQTRFEELLSKRDYLCKLYEKPELDKDTLEKINDIYSNFIKMIEKNSFKAGYIILDEYHGLPTIDNDMIAAIKKEKDLELKKDLYLNLWQILEQPKVSEILIFKELMYNKINMFYENISFYLSANLKTDIAKCYRKDFIEPILAEITGKRTGKKRCIECSNLATTTRAISYMLDTTDDVNRKKSYYWNLVPDAFVCPICAFLYTLVPLGFEFYGGDAVFINNNYDIETMKKFMSTYRDKAAEKDDKKSLKSKLYRGFTEEKAEIISKKIDNLQIVFKNRNGTHYQLNIIDMDTVAKLHQGAKYLAPLEHRYLQLRPKEYLNVYDEVMDNILYRRSQDKLMEKLLKLELKSGNNTNYLYNLLGIQIIFKGGNHMDTSNKKVDIVSELRDKARIASSCGKAMRNILAGDVGEKDKDNKLRGFVYKLLNDISVGNVNRFLDSITRVYSGKGLPIPGIFLNCYDSNEVFKAIGYGYILGLKYVKYEAKNKEDVRDEK